MGTPALRLVRFQSSCAHDDRLLWGGASGHTYTFKHNLNGTTDIDVVVVRDGKNFKGRALGLVLGTIGKGVLEKAFKNSVAAIEARNSLAAIPA